MPCFAGEHSAVSGKKRLFFPTHTSKVELNLHENKQAGATGNGFSPGEKINHQAAKEATGHSTPRRQTISGRGGGGRGHQIMRPETCTEAQQAEPRELSTRMEKEAGVRPLGFLGRPAQP